MKYDYKRIINSFIIFVIISLLFILGSQNARSEETAKPSLNLRGKVIDVYDGDTVTMRFTIDVRVRLLDCWAPEIRTKDANEKQAGMKSKANLEGLAGGKDAVLSIPLGGVTRLDDIFTFGRILGWIYVNGKDVSAEQVKAGVATKTKQRKEMEVDP